MANNKKHINAEQQHERMMNTPIPKLVLSLALPTTASQLITVIYNTADTYFVSHIGTSAAAAVGVVLSMMSIIHACGFGIGMGVNSVISRKLGAKKNDEASVFASSAFFAAIAVGLILMIAGLLTLKDLMILLGSTETILPYSCDYARYILIGAPVMCASFVLNNALRSEGKAVLSMWGLCIGGILNIILDPIFIFVMDMGIAGAALATTLSQCVSFMVLLSAFLCGKSNLKINIKLVSRTAKTYIIIIKNGFPTICRQGMASIASALLNIQAAAYGDAALAAITISNKVYLLIRNLVLGIGQGFQPIAGYNYGAGNKARVKQAFKFTCILGTAICVLCSAGVALNAATIITWFREDAQVVAIGTQALYFNCLIIPFMAYSTYVNQLYQCLGFSTQATFLASCRQGIFFIPLIFVLPRLIGITGIEATQPAADMLTFLISIPLQIAFYRKRLNSDTFRKDIFDRT